jgi:hypothetical protein
MNGELEMLRVQIDAVCILARKALDDGELKLHLDDRPDSWRILRLALDAEPQEFVYALPAS